MKSRLKTIPVILILVFFCMFQFLHLEAVSQESSDSLITKKQSENENNSNISEKTQFNQIIFLTNPLVSITVNSDILDLDNQVKKEQNYSEIFKFTTTADDPVHRCYEIVAPLPKNYNLHFTFMPLEKFTSGGSK